MIVIYRLQMNLIFDVLERYSIFKNLDWDVVSRSLGSSRSLIVLALFWTFRKVVYGPLVRFGVFKSLGSPGSLDHCCSRRFLNFSASSIRMWFGLVVERERDINVDHASSVMCDIYILRIYYWYSNVNECRSQISYEWF